MNKKLLKKENQRLQEQLQEMKLVFNARLPLMQKFPDNSECNEAVEDDRYRQEAYAKVKEWVLEYLQAELEKIREDYNQSLDAERKVLKRYERKIDAYASESRFLKKGIKYMEKRVIVLEGTIKKIKTILRRIGFCANVADLDASLKEVSKGFKRKCRKRNKYLVLSKKEEERLLPGLNKDDIIDAEWKER